MVFAGCGNIFAAGPSVSMEENSMATLRNLAVGLMLALPTVVHAGAPSASAGSDLPPAVVAPALQLLRETNLLSFVVTAADPDQDAITSLTGSGLPPGATFTPNGTHTSGVFRWTPTIEQAGEYDIVFTASNALSGSAPTHIRVFNRTNLGVVFFGPIEDVAVSEGGSAIVNVNVYDYDGATISLDASGLPPFATLNPPTSSTGSYILETSITIAPGAGTAGSYPVTLTSTSVGGCGAPFCTIIREAFTITVVPAGSDLPPAVTAPSLLFAKAENPLTFVVTAADPDQDAITSLTASGLPSGATFTSNGTYTSGTLTWTPPLDPEVHTTVYEIAFTASNALSGSAKTRILVSRYQNLNLLVISPIDDVTVSEGGSATVGVSMRDPDGGTISLSASGLPAFATLNPPTSGVGTGTIQTTITIAPGAGTAGSYPVVLRATSVGECDPPRVSGGTELVCDNDFEEFTITVTGGGPGELETVATLIGNPQLHKKSLCFRIRQDQTPFDLRDVDLGSITLAFEGRAINALARATHVGFECDDCVECEDEDEDCEADQLRACFSMEAIRSLFGGEDVVNGLSNSELHGNLESGQSFVADIGGSLTDGHHRDRRSAKLQVRPNPLNPAADITFTLARAGNVRISLYDVRGRLVKRILDERRLVGDYAVSWDGTTMNGDRVPSGVYFVKIQASQVDEVKRVTVLK
jgi:FlgD Ig-like domain/Putative Ig domain